MPGVEKTMHEFKTGELRSGSGAKVTSREQAIAIALSEEREAKKKKRKSTDGERVMARWNSDKEFSSERRETLAKSGKAMKGGGFPIENESDLKNAIHAIGRAKNPSAAKAHIKKRARALGKSDLIPENWDSDEQGWLALADPVELSSDARRHRGDNGDDDDDEEDDDDDDEDRYSDSRTVFQLVDRFVIDGKARRTENGYLVADALIARTGIQLYGGDELGRPDIPVVRVYRPPEEVFRKKALSSLSNLPITLEHPPQMVDSANWKQYSVGHTDDEVVRDGDCVRTQLILMDAKAVEAYEKHGVRELSVGYGCEIKWGEGKTPSGEVYDAKQVAIRGNHLAVVPAARGGSRLRIGDDQEQGEFPMARILIGDRLVELAENEAQHVQAFIAKLTADAKKKNGNGDDDEDSESAEEEQAEEKKTRGEKDAARVRAEKDAATLRGENAALKKQLEDANAKTSGKALDEIVKERTELMLRADAAMDGKMDFAGKEPAEIRRLVVEAKLGDAAKGMTEHELAGAFKAITANVKPRSGTDRLADNLSMLQLGGGNSNNPKAMKDAAYGEYVNRIGQSWRGIATQNAQR